MLYPTQKRGLAEENVSEAGYNLLILMMLVLFTNVMLGVAMQKWSDRIQREKEEELIFRGMQYAEGIRIFQTRHGRPPTKLEELVELEPRSMRQLYPNPFNDDGAWGVLLQSQRPGGGGQNLVPGQGNQDGGLEGQNQGGLNQGAQSQAGQPGRRGGGRGGRAGRAPTGPGAQRQGGQNRQPGGSGLVAIPPSDERDTFGQRRRTTTTGPIVGVYAAVEEGEEAFHVFMDQTDISKWQFRADMVPMPVVAGADMPTPRPNSGIFWRPFPKDLQPQSGGMPGQQGRGGQSLTPGGGPSPGFNPGLRPAEGDSGSRLGGSRNTPPPRPRRN